MPTRFKNRMEAGRALAERIRRLPGIDHAIVLALPRGGVPVGFAVAEALHVPLDVFLVRKLGVPGHEELAMGAIASGGLRVMNEQVLEFLHLPQEAIDRVTRSERAELERRERAYRGDRPMPEIAGHTVILVDDGLATGSSMRAAVEAVRRQDPARVIVAVPVAAAETCQALRSLADEVICAITPDLFHAVGLWYEDFSQTTDEEVRDLLSRAARLAPPDPPAAASAAQGAGMNR